VDNKVTDRQERFQNNYILQAWLCISLAFLFGIALAGVQASLGPIIAANKINETKAKVPELLVGTEQAAKMAAEDTHFVVDLKTVTIEKAGRQKLYTVYKADYPDGRPAGYVTKTGGQGYADRIELLLGLDPSAEKITGVFILDQKETPGLGNKIIEPKWRNQFEQKSTDRPLTVVKAGASQPNEIDAVSGATISSVSVVNIINNTVADLKETLSAAKQQKKD